LAIIFVVWAFISFQFYRLFFSWSTSIIILCVAFYPNFLLWLKLLITSDVPFCLLILLICYIIQTKKLKAAWQYARLAILIGFASQTRSIGIVILPALCAHYVHLNFLSKRRSLAEKASFSSSGLGIVISISLIVYFSFSYLFTPQHSYVSNSLGLISLQSVLQSGFKHLLEYTECYSKLFISTDTSLKQLSLICSILIPALTALGIILKWIDQIDFFDWFVVLYLLVIFGYPVGADYRYVAPVHTFLLFYFFYSLKRVGTLIKIPAFIPQLLLIALFILLYRDHINYLIRTTHEVVPGPYEEICQETFGYLRANFPDNEIIVFNKPRALALYTRKKVTMHNFEASPSYNFTRLKALGARYYLFSNTLNEADYKAILDSNKNKMIEVYKNWQFTLYKDTTASKNNLN
jgi:hypothetical protein